VFGSTLIRKAHAKQIFGRKSGGSFGLIVALAVSLFAVSAATLSAKHQHLESWYADALAEQLAGARTEVRMKNGTRCDVLATHHSIEVEFAAKWCEAIGQSLNYASQTGRLGAIALILENGSDERFLVRLRQVISWHQLSIAVIVMRPFNADGLEIQYPAGITGRPAGTARVSRKSLRPSIDFRLPVDAMDWIPRIRVQADILISTQPKKNK